MAAAAAAGAGAGAGADDDNDDEDEEDANDVDDAWDNSADAAETTDAADAAGADIEIDDGKGALERGGEASWKRPAVPVPLKTIAFQQIDTDYLVSKTPYDLVRTPKQSVMLEQRSAIPRLYGVTAQGQSVCAYVHGFLPYFYVPCWSGFTAHDLHEFGDALNLKLAEAKRERDLKRYVLDIRVVNKQTIWDYQGNGLQPFLRITVALPSLVPAAGSILSKGLPMGSTSRVCALYESNVLFILRFMVDTNIKSGAWIEIKDGTYRMRPERKKLTHCQIEVDVHVDALIPHEPVGEWMHIAPLRTLSTDIECAGRKGHFPEPDKDPVIQISNVVTVYGQKDPIIKNVFVIGTCAPIIDCQIVSFENELDMLLAWRHFMLTVDPDIITGYNVIDFDLNYLIERAAHLEEGGSRGYGDTASSEAVAVGGKRKQPPTSSGFGRKRPEFLYLSRPRGTKSTIRDKVFESKAFGKRISKEIKMEGRVLMCVLSVIRREHKLRGYKLDSVSQHFLNKRKEDVPHGIISTLFHGTAETRRRLASYCLQDSMLVVELTSKLMLIVNFMEMARVTGVPFQLLLTRGQQVKVMMQILRKTRVHSMVVPVRDRMNVTDKYEGATVLQPKTNFYDVPIATLDFASLYPSIMMAHNLCYSTRITEARARQMNPEHYTKTPCGAYFVKPVLATGILPEILKELIDTRSAAKKLMKTEKDEFAQAVLNGRQLALKVSANSVYGFTGATVGQLPCLDISTSVTAFGRQMIEHTKRRVEEHYTIANGRACNAEVVYGDTDSVMVKFGVTTVADALRLGKEAAEMITKDFKFPIKLEFEKVYYPYLLMGKKRYAGLYWTNDKKWDKRDTKGIETVRRDNCRLVVEIMEQCLDMLLGGAGVQKVIDYVKGRVSDLLQGKIDMSLLVISKALSKGASASDYKTRSAHVELAERMRKRDPLTAPVTGDRVPYVTVTAHKTAKAYEKGENPLYAIEHGVPIDYQWYIEKQLTKPLKRLLGHIEAVDIKSLFAGDHTCQLKLQTNEMGALTKFAVRVHTCLGCKTPLKTAAAVCAACKSKERELHAKYQTALQQADDTCHRAWSECQRCQGSRHQAVLCESTECPNFYHRSTARRNLRAAAETLQRFGDLTF